LGTPTEFRKGTETAIRGWSPFQFDSSDFSSTKIESFQQFESFDSGDVIPTSSSISFNRQLKRPTLYGDADKLAAKKASAKLQLVDVRGAIRILSSDRSYIAPDDASLALLRARHPHAPNDRRPAPPPATDSLTCSVQSDAGSGFDPYPPPRGHNFNPYPPLIYIVSSKPRPPRGFSFHPHPIHAAFKPVPVPIPVTYFRKLNKSIYIYINLANKF